MSEKEADQRARRWVARVPHSKVKGLSQRSLMEYGYSRALIALSREIAEKKNHGQAT